MPTIPAFRLFGSWPGPPGAEATCRAAARSAAGRSPPFPRSDVRPGARGLLPGEARPGATMGQYVLVGSAVDNLGKPRSVSVDSRDRACEVRAGWGCPASPTRDVTVHGLWKPDCSGRAAFMIAVDCSQIRQQIRRDHENRSSRCRLAGRRPAAGRRAPAYLSRCRVSHRPRPCRPRPSRPRPWRPLTPGRRCRSRAGP